MFKVKQKDIRETPTNYVFMSMDVIPLYLLLILDILHFTPFTSVFMINCEQVNTDWE